MLFNNNIHLDSISSTNNFLLSLRKNNIFFEGLYVTTDFQENGKGQINNSWQSEKNKNLLISILIEPKISINNIFDINRFVCLSIKDLLKLYGINALIKWPNDIIINNRKIAGILIENIFSKNIISHSVIGIGLNINQGNFLQYNPPATSMFLELINNFDTHQIKQELLDIIELRYKKLKIGYSDLNEYNNKLYLLEKSFRFMSNNKQFYGRIKTTLDNGSLVIYDESNGIEREFLNSELKYIF